MRRHDRQITSLEEIEKIISEAEVLRIALNDTPSPYILPLNFGHSLDLKSGEILLYFHGAKEGRKIELIEKDNNVSFELDCRHKLLPSEDSGCMTSFAYASVIGNGFITKVEDDDKERVLSIILEHYNIKNKNFNSKMLDETAVYQITATSVTAKSKKAL